MADVTDKYLLAPQKKPKRMLSLATWKDRFEFFKGTLVIKRQILYPQE
jgi:hypothetical protein